MKPDSNTIERLVNGIVQVANPLKIILFGSAARGDTSEGSDIDVLVVVPNGTHRRRTAQKLYRELTGMGVPFDVIVATPVDLETHKDNIGLIYSTVLQEGREIYAL